jgi:MFS family permease
MSRVSDATGMRSRWQRTAGGLPRAFWYLWAGQLVNRLGYFVQPFLTLYLVRDRELPVTTAGVLVAAFGAGSLVSQVVAGWMVDRIGRRVTLVVGMLGTAVCLLGLGFSTALVPLALFAAASGLMIDVYRPAVSALVADLVPPGDRVRAFGLLYWAVNLGVSVAAVLGGALASRGYWLLFVLDAVTCVGFAVLIARGVPETRPQRPPSAGGSGYGVALRDRLLLALAGTNLVGAAVYGQCFVTLPLAITADGLGPGAYGLVYAVNPVAVIVLQPLTLRWLSARPPVLVAAASSVVMGLGFGATAFASTVPAYALTVLVWTLGEIGFNAVAPALVADIAPPEQRGRYNGVLGLSFGGAALVGPVAGTAVLQTFGEPTLWSGCLVASLASAAATLALGPALARRSAAAEPAPA